ncbi:MAG: acyltransferase [Sphingobacteriales bacterium]|nr:MAG: acyltransferase [Sphingobacteriales bacterium]
MNMDAANQRFLNNFDLLRMVAAVCITFTHSFNLLGKNNEEPLMNFTGERYDFSFIGLCIFFSISGYLIAKSACTSTSILNYWWKRFLRIQPLLILVCVLSIFMLGPVFTNLPAADYWGNINTWTYLRNVFPATGIQFTLPGVFTTNVVESSINGSLWTLVVEERLYIIVSVIFFLKPAKKWFFIVPLILLNIVFFLSHFAEGMHFLAYFKGVHIFYALIFLNASASCLFKINFFKLASSVALLAVVLAMCLCVSIEALHYLSVFAAPLLVISLAHVKAFTNKAGKWGDFTYGIYIFSFPVQQVFIYLSANQIAPWSLFVKTMLVVFPLSVLSWHFFEKKFLALKSRIK